jgi:hypothetical protein
MAALLLFADRHRPSESGPLPDGDYGRRVVAYGNSHNRETGAGIRLAEIPCSRDGMTHAQLESYPDLRNHFGVHRGPDRPPSTERRRYGRIRLDRPIRGRFGAEEVRVTEVSISGFRITHQRPLEPEPRLLVIDWDGRRMELTCRAERSALVRLAKNTTERNTYESGIQIVEASPEARAQLHEFIAERIIRALDEQKANARGVPPLAAYMYQPGKGDLFRRCEWISGTWRKAETTRDEQPPHGFTISAEVASEYVGLLCRTWETTTEEGRRLTQLLAELSIRKSEGIPTRRFIP